MDEMVDGRLLPIHLQKHEYYLLISVCLVLLILNLKFMWATGITCSGGMRVFGQWRGLLSHLKSFEIFKSPLNIVILNTALRYQFSMYILCCL